MCGCAGSLLDRACSWGRTWGPAHRKPAPGLLVYSDCGRVSTPVKPITACRGITQSWSASGNAAMSTTRRPKPISPTTSSIFTALPGCIRLCAIARLSNMSGVTTKLRPPDISVYRRAVPEMKWLDHDMPLSYCHPRGASKAQPVSPPDPSISLTLSLTHNLRHKQVAAAVRCARGANPGAARWSCWSRFSKPSYIRPDIGRAHKGQSPVETELCR